MKMSQFAVNKQLLPMKAHYFLWNAGTGPVVPYLSSYARQLGFSSVTVGFIYTVLPVSGMLAKPLFGSIADRFRCKKMLFLIAQLLTAIAFLAVFYSPQVEVNRHVHFSCYDNIPAFNNLSQTSLSSCNIQQIQEEDIVNTCKMNCDVNSNISAVLCQEWQLDEFCDSSNFTGNYTFNVDVPRSKMDFLNATIIFRISRIFSTNGTTVNSTCPAGQPISTICSIDCDDYSINDLIAKPSISDAEVYSIYEFWTFLLLMVCAWIGQAIAVSIGDAICFEILGDKPNKYGAQRMFGALGWGISSAFAGFLIDYLSRGQSEKNYTSAFYMAAIFLVLDFFVSSRIQNSQKQISSNIVRDVGKLLVNVNINIYLVWCVSVGMCTGLIWQFLFWLIEDLASQQGCETVNHVKTLQGIIQAIQCLLGEMPFFFLSGRIIKKLGHVNTMSLVLMALSARFHLYSVITNPWLFLPVELLNGLTFGLFFACMASYASIIAPPGTEATMQGLVGAVFEGIGVSAGSALGGLSYKLYGGPMTFRYFGYGALSLCGAHVAGQLILKTKDSKPEYSAPNDALERTQQDDQQELTFVES